MTDKKGWRADLSQANKEQAQQAGPAGPAHRTPKNNSLNAS